MNSAFLYNSAFFSAMLTLECPYEKRILPYLQQPLVPPDELWLMGQDGEYVTVHPQLASTLLDLVLDTSSVTVPDAPIAALQELAQLLHIGKYGKFVNSTGSHYRRHSSTNFRTSSNISKETRDWVLYLFANLHGDTSFLSTPALSEDPHPSFYELEKSFQQSPRSLVKLSSSSNCGAPPKPPAKASSSLTAATCPSAPILPCAGDPLNVSPKNIQSWMSSSLMSPTPMKRPRHSSDTDAPKSLRLAAKASSPSVGIHLHNPAVVSNPLKLDHSSHDGDGDGAIGVGLQDLDPTDFEVIVLGHEHEGALNQAAQVRHVEVALNRSLLAQRFLHISHLVYTIGARHTCCYPYQRGG